MNYFYYDTDHPSYRLLAYAKAVASDMSTDDKKAASALAAIIEGRGIQDAGQKEQKR